MTVHEFCAAGAVVACCNLSSKPTNLPVEPVGDTSFFLDWIGLRENLQEIIDFPNKYGAFLQIFP